MRREKENKADNGDSKGWRRKMNDGVLLSIVIKFKLFSHFKVILK